MATTPETASHAPGNCPDSAYGKDCNGIATYGTDPYAEDNHNNTKVWMCEGVRYGRAMDI
jgi:hypothetical protein